jgi:hypothetical protein
MNLIRLFPSVETLGYYHDAPLGLILAEVLRHPQLSFTVLLKVVRLLVAS